MKKQQTKYIYERSNEWELVNADGQVLGRLASDIARKLMGKDSVNYTPSSDTGVFVVVYNAEKVVVTGNKASDKAYYRHSRFPGGLRTDMFKDLQKSNPERIIMLAVKGMLPKNRLASKLLTKLKVYAGSNHPHQAQVSEKKSEANKGA